MPIYTASLVSTEWACVSALPRRTSIQNLTLTKFLMRIQPHQEERALQASDFSVQEVLLVHLALVPGIRYVRFQPGGIHRSSSSSSEYTAIHVGTSPSPPASVQRTFALCFPAARARCLARRLLPSGAGSLSPSSAARCGFCCNTISHTSGMQNPHGLLLLNVVKPEK